MDNNVGLRPNRSVGQLVSGVCDVGLVVHALKDADEAALAIERAAQADFGRSQAGESCHTLAGIVRRGTPAEEADKGIATPFRVVGESLWFDRIGLFLRHRALSGGTRRRHRSRCRGRCGCLLAGCWGLRKTDLSGEQKCQR